MFKAQRSEATISFFLLFFFIVVFKEVEDMEVRERRERRAQQCLDVKDGTVRKPKPS